MALSAHGLLEVAGDQGPLVVAFTQCKADGEFLYGLAPQGVLGTVVDALGTIEAYTVGDDGEATDPVLSCDIVMVPKGIVGSFGAQPPDGWEGTAGDGSNGIAYFWDESTFPHVDSLRA